jgi:ligand-binding SRPBCC domain-containing protein
VIDHIIEQRLLIGRARPEVFAFFADPTSTGRLLPPWIRVTLVGGARRAVEAGMILDYRVACLRVPVRWRAFVRECDPPFLAEGAGTLMEDRLVYRLPLGLLGRAAHTMAVGHLMAAAWRHRTRRIGELVGPVSWPPG